jgi:hypothetical protein
MHRQQTLAVDRRAASWQRGVMLKVAKNSRASINGTLCLADRRMSPAAQSVNPDKGRALVLGVMLLLLSLRLEAGVPNLDLDAATTAGNFAGYHARLSAWLNQQVPADSNRLSEAVLEGLLQDRAFANTLDQWQLIRKHGVADLAVFTAAGQRNRTFLAWLLRNTEALDLYLEGAVPTGLAAREQNSYSLPTAALETWRRIFDADPTSRDGLYLKLAIATAVSPPGSGNHGAGQREPFGDAVDRYQHFKAAHGNKELFPSFDHLTVWEYRQIVSSCASDADLAWARAMINTWRPDLRTNEQVVNSTSEVQYRASPFPYTNGFKSVIAGGGKCGPRSSWAVMICQAFGVPAIGVGQPGHACVAYKAAYPAVQPQPGNAWKVAYGRGWQVSKLDGLSGPDFLAGMSERSRAGEFSRVEHLRWLASALAPAERAAAVMAVAHGIQQAAAATTPKTDLAAPGKAEEAEKELTPVTPPAGTTPPRSEKPVKVAPGLTRVEAASFARMSGVCVYESLSGRRQVSFQKNLQTSWVEFALEVPATGTYRLKLRTATPNFDQVLDISLGTNKPATVKVPNTEGLWGTTEEVNVSLDKGSQTLRVSAPHQRGVAVQWLELRRMGAGF